MIPKIKTNYDTIFDALIEKQYEWKAEHNPEPKLPIPDDIIVSWYLFVGENEANQEIWFNTKTRNVFRR